MSLEAALSNASYYQILDLPEDALTGEIEARCRGELAPEFGGIPSMMATPVWREARDAGHYFGGPTLAEHKVFRRYFDSAAEVLRDPRQRAEYDREHAATWQVRKAGLGNKFDASEPSVVLGLLSLIFLMVAVDRLAEDGIALSHSALFGFAILGLGLGLAIHGTVPRLTEARVASARSEGRSDALVVRASRMLPWCVVAAFTVGITALTVLTA